MKNPHCLLLGKSLKSSKFMQELTFPHWIFLRDIRLKIPLVQPCAQKLFVWVNKVIKKKSKSLRLKNTS